MKTTLISPKHYSSNRYGVRSISLPTRSHPSTIRIEEELIKLKSWQEASSSSSTSKVGTICHGLSGLTELYKCIEELLKLPLTQQALIQHKNEKWLNDLLDSPLSFLDQLAKTRDSILLMKGKIEELQSALRRRKVIGDLGIETSLSAYWSLRRNMRKECTKSLLLLKQIDASFGVYFPLDLDSHLSSIVRVLRESNLITSSILESIVVFLSSPILKSKLNKWALVSRLMQKGVLACNDEQENISELEKVDFALSNLFMENLSKDVEAEKIQTAHRRIEALVVSIERIENESECLFKRLINARVFFLNIFSP